jgi:predicted acylesterase/phospholipase RssA
MNNLPVDLLHEIGCLHVIGINVGSAGEIYAKEDTLPSTFTILKNKFFGGKLRYPSFLQVMDRSLMLASFKHTKDMIEQANLVFQPNVKKINLTEWKRFYEVKKIGYDHAKEILKKMSEEKKSLFK